MKSAADPVYILERELESRWNRSRMFLKRLQDRDPNAPRPIQFGPPTGKRAFKMYAVEDVERYEKENAARTAEAARKPKPRLPARR
jgi:hypothetical protein